VLPAIGAAFPEAANNPVKVLRQMFTWACSPEYGYAEKNPLVIDGGVTGGARPRWSCQR
jgi:hypothetical protein